MVLVALMMTGCLPGKRKAEPVQSVAKESVWDFYLVGTWRYTEDESEGKSGYPKGTETFYGDGKYSCIAYDSSGKKVTIEGAWRLDDKEDFVVWINQKSVKSGNRIVSKEKKTVKYVVNSLAPEQALVYQVDNNAYRSAEWVK